MVQIRVPVTLLFVIIFCITDSTCSIWKRKDSNVRSSVPNYAQFTRLASLMFGKEPPQTTHVCQECKDPKELEFAAKSLMALALSNNLIQPANGAVAKQVAEFYKSLATRSETKIAATLTQYIIHDLQQVLYKTYKTYLLNSTTPIEAMSLAMRDYDRIKSGVVPRTRDPNPASLGCEFDDYEYSYSKTTKRGIPPKRRTLLWESEDKITPMIFDEEIEFGDFIETLEKLCGEVMETTTYNDIDQLIRFVSEFKNQQTDQTINRFFDKYTYKFRPSEDTAIYELEFIKQLAETYPQAKEHFYLVSVTMDNGDVYEYGVRDAMSEGSKVVHAHVAGAFKIMYKQRPGWIIIDLNIGLRNPIVFMEDGNYPNLVDRRKERLGFAQTPYAIFWVEFGDKKASKKEWLQGLMYEKQEKYIISHFRIDVRRPFCDFLRTTFKPNLMMPVHGMLRRQQNGEKKALVNFRILPKKLLGGDYSFTVAQFDKTGFSGNAKTILFKDLDTMTKSDNGTLAEVAKSMGLAANHLLGKMMAIKMLVFDDDDLVNKVYKFNQANNYLDKWELNQAKKRKPTREDFMNSASMDVEKFKAAMVMTQTQEDEFLNAIKNQNKCVKRVHITNLPRNIVTQKELKDNIGFEHKPKTP